jgi:hypothetical protein
MSVRLIKMILRASLISFVFAFFTGSCATLDKLDRFIYDVGRPDPDIQHDTQPAKRVPLPPTIKDFESKPPDA